MRPAAARHLATALVGAALAAAIGAAAPAAAAAPRPPAVDAEAFIVVDRASGAKIAGEDVHERRPIASTTKLMTALLTLERADPRELLTASSYEPEPIESQIGLEEGERLAVRDLLVALLLESANDAAATLAARLDSSTGAFVADMNARAEELGLDHTSYANPIGFDAARNYSTAADLARLARVLLRDDRFSHIVEQPRLELHTGDRPRVVYNRNDLVGEVPFVDGVKTGNTLGAGHVLVGSATRDEAGVVSVVLGAPSEATRDNASESLLRYGLDQFRERRVLRPREPLADVAAAGVEQRVPVAAARGLSLTLLRGQPVETQVDAPPQLEGPLPAGERVGSVAVLIAGEEFRRVPLVTARAVPEPQDLVSRVASTLRERPIQAAAVVAAVAALLAAAVALGGSVQEKAAQRRQRHRRATHVIITITLNAAVDKTLAVPNFRLGRRHRAIEQRALAGGKGVNVARALKSLGQPVIATGLAGGSTGTRIIEQLTDEAILNDFVRIQEESRTSTAVVDPASGEQTEINEYGPEVSEHEVDLFRDNLLYLAKGAAVCVFCGSLPRGAPPSLYADLVGELRKLDVTTVLDSEGEALDLATRAEPTVVTPNELEAEELVGHEFDDEQDRLTAVREIVDLGASEAVMTQPTGCVGLVADGEAGSSRGGSRRLYRCTLEPVDTPVSGVGSGDAFLAGYVASRYSGRSAEEGLRFAVACGAESTQHFGAGVLDARAVERLAGDVEVEALEEPALEARG